MESESRKKKGKTKESTNIDDGSCTRRKSQILQTSYVPRKKKVERNDGSVHRYQRTTKEKGDLDE